MNHDAILFDLDGTLLDSLRDIAEAGNRVLATFGFPAHPVDRYRTMVGDGVEILARRILPEAHRDPATIADVASAYRADYAKSWDVHSAPYDGVAELLTALAERKVRMAILSNKPHVFTLQCVGQFLAGHTFDVIQGAGGAFAPKPDPAGALHVAKELGIAPTRFLYVGDTDTDMKTATAAGMYAVGALWGFRSREELVASGAAVLAATPGDVLGFL